MRVELFGDEVESLRWFSTFTQRSLGDAERVEIAPAAELDAELPRARRDGGRPRTGGERPDVAEVLPVDDFRSFLELVRRERVRDGGRRGGAAPGARRPLAGRHHQPPLRRRAPPLPAARARSARRSQARAEVTLSAVSARPAAPVPRAGRRHRGALDHGGRAGAREARALRLRDGRRLGPARRGRARRLQPRAPAAALRRRRRAPSARDCGSRRRGCARASSRRS